jgi:hypothetical protein
MHLSKNVKGWTAGGGLPGKVLSPRRGPLETTESGDMRVDVDSIASSSTGLHLGCVVHGPEDSWVRFSQVLVPWALVTYELVQAIQENMSNKWREEAELDGLF